MNKAQKNSGTFLANYFKLAALGVFILFLLISYGYIGRWYWQFDI